MSTMRQQILPNSSKNIFRKQKSIEVNVKPANDGKKALRKQLSVDHVTPNLKQVSSSTPVHFSSFLWRNSSASLNESNLRIVPSSSVKKRAQFANTSSLSKQERFSDCVNGSTMVSVGEGTRTRVNINIFISQDVTDDLLSDNEGAPQVESQTQHNKATSNTPTNAPSKPSGNTNELSVVGARGATASARRAQFQASRRIMSAPIRPMMTMDDPKNKRKARKKKVLRVNLTLNRDKDDFDDSPDDSPETVERKPTFHQQAPKAPSKAKQLTTRSRSVLGCDQVGIETLVSMLSSGGSDSEKEEAQQAQTPPTPKPETSKTRSNMLRKSVSFQDDDSFLQPTLNKDPFTRRSTIVPFAGRMRNTRSLFGQEISNLYLPNSSDEEKSSESKNENDLNSNNKPNDEETERIKTKKGSEENADDKKTQDNQTPKEQECWRLYEKMKKTGLNVSYDTILRGILKPSELRLLEKQKKYLGDIAEKSVDCNDPPTESQTVN